MPKIAFTAQQIVQIRKLLREAANERDIPIQTGHAVGPLRDEIDALRRTGMDDDQIAGLISDGAGVRVSADDVRSFHAAPPDRPRGPGPDAVKSDAT